eukprot:14637485-Alexandrium_andersonii.AAC.1
MVGKQAAPGSPAPSTPPRSNAMSESSCDSARSGRVILPVPPTPASSSQSPAVAEAIGGAADGATPPKELACSTGVHFDLYPVNKNLKRKR